MSKRLFGNISLCWRPTKGEPRIVVGIIREKHGNVTFSYTDEARKAAVISGFTPYSGFPDLDTEYKENVLDIFAQRLTRAERPDISRYYEFWNISEEYKNNKLYLLAKTQGLVANDMFEFLADYNPSKGLDFISEISGLTKAQLPIGTIKVGDKLTWKRVQHPKDKHAVRLFYDRKKIGYVKIVHNRLFYKTKHQIKISVVSIETNGHINKAYIRIRMNT